MKIRDECLHIIMVSCGFFGARGRILHLGGIHTCIHTYRCTYIEIQQSTTEYSVGNSSK